MLILQNENFCFMSYGFLRVFRVCSAAANWCLP